MPALEEITLGNKCTDPREREEDMITMRKKTLLDALA